MFSSETKIKYTLIVAAAGIGKRMGLNYPKQFLEYKGKPLFINVLETAENSSVITEILVVTGKDFIDEVRKLCKKYNITKVKEVVEGGKERQDSIYNALKYCDDNSVIGVQDGVRPFVKEEYFRNSLEEINNNQELAGVVVGVPAKDTIKIINGDGKITDTPVRKRVVIAQTPQVFRGKILKDSYRRAEEDGFVGTDDSSLVEKYGGEVKVILGDYGNIKITTIEDIKFLK